MNVRERVIDRCKARRAFGTPTAIYLGAVEWQEFRDSLTLNEVPEWLMDGQETWRGMRVFSVRTESHLEVY